MRVVTYEETLRALNEAVRERGYNYVYPRNNRGVCYNVFQGKPDCIVGWVMIRLGVPIEWFKEDTRENDNVGDVCRALFFQKMFEFEEAALDLLTDVQISQDSGSTWGVSVTRAHLGEEWYASLYLHRNAA